MSTAPAELFTADAVAAPSPRLAWMQRHGILTHSPDPDACPPVWFAGFRHWWPELTGAVFFAAESATYGALRVGQAPSEEEALADLMTCPEARHRKLQHWSAA